MFQCFLAFPVDFFINKSLDTGSRAGTSMYPLYSFGNYQNGSQPFGKIYELRIYQTNLSPAEREVIEDELATKWSITLP